MRLDQPFNSEAASHGQGGDFAPGAEAKKPRLDQSIASLLLMTALAGGGLYYMHLRTAPALASDAVPSDTQVLIDNFMAGGQQKLANIDSALRATNDLVESLRVRPSERIASENLPGPGDPFEYTPLNPIARDAQTPAAPDPQKLTREQARQKALDAVRKLRLQSVMHGSQRRACMINNKLYFEGQTVDGFTVAAIARGEVTVRSGEFQFSLKMSR